MKLIKYLKFLPIILLFNSLTIANTQIYKEAVVNRKAIDLYSKATQDSKISSNEFLEGEIIKIYECTSLGWCRTDNGFVKKHLLKFKRTTTTYKDENITPSSSNIQRERTNIEAPKRSFKKWKNNEIFQRTSVDEDIKDILTSIALQNGSQILFGKNIVGAETLSIDSMPLEGAFNLLLQRNNLEYKWQGNTIIVNSISETTIKKEFLILQELSVTKLIRLLKRYNLYGSLKHKVTFDKEMNAIYIEAEKEIIDDLQKLIARFELAEKLRNENRIERTKQNISYQKLKIIEEKNKAFVQKKKKFGFDEYDDWTMKIDIIPLKYINVSAREIEFLGKKIKVESLEETLKGLLGTGYSGEIYSDINTKEENKTTEINNNLENKKDIKFSSDLKVEEKAYLKVDKRTNSVIIKDYPDRIEEIKKIVKKLDKPAKLVEIEVTVATGNSGLTKKLGTQLGGSRKVGDRQFGISTSKAISESVNDPSTGSLLETTNTIGLSSSMIFTGSRSYLNVQLNAMEEEGTGKIISNPRIVTLDNKEATILSGKSLSIPITTDNKIELERVNTGISIIATPHVIEKDNDTNKYLMIDVRIEKSELGVVTDLKIEKATNEINSNIIIKSGQTLILGGLFTYDKTNSNTGVPLLKDIPLLGFLFSTKSKILNKTELLFFITPKIITPNILEDQKNSDYMSYKKIIKKEKYSLSK